ncbi:MAG TPA: aromatic ring-hydroxylating dioxygenase subunit alpha [Burkholderiales bacterium]|jgi:choline monooxygenase|nr:aromatic ring-hydroxylating dioxygenase subunit alpha [Burkholderiales bacterium]
MTDIASHARLKAADSQLPVRWYFDPAIFAMEREVLFARGPNYVGHELMVPEIGDYQTIAWLEHGKTLVRTASGVALLSNVCRHRQALLLEGRGNAQNIVCPVHRWTYDLHGKLLGAPDFAENPGLCLPETPLQNWHGLLFAGPLDVNRALADFPLAGDYDFSGYVYEKTTVDECPFNWKAFLEIYLELYHVEFFHPGLKRFVDGSNYQWGFGDRWSYQIMGIKDQFRHQTSPNYTRYRDAILAYNEGKLPKYGTLWCILFPNVMLEWYPFALVVSTLIPRSPEHTTNVVDFFYPEEVAAFERELVEAHQAAYLESAAEDAQICTLLHRGRKGLHAAGLDDRGPYHSPHEDGMIHFHEFLREELGLREQARRIEG